MTKTQPCNSRGTTGQIWLLATFVLFIVASLLGASKMAESASSEVFSNTTVTARLISAENGVAPGATTVSAGLDLQLGDGWKTYWRSPGEVGLPPEVEWDQSENVESVELLWPAPKRFTAFGIENFGYADQVVFPLRVELKTPGAPARLNAKVNILICSDVCVPQNFDLSLPLPAMSGIDRDAADLITKFAKKVPVEGPENGVAIEVAAIAGDPAMLTVTARKDRAFEAPDVFPEMGMDSAFGKPDIRLGDAGRLMWARLPILAMAPEASGFQVTITDGDQAVTIAPAVTDTPPAPPFALSAALPGLDQLVWIALVAFLGGLILNVMPCVLPVLSIKLSSVVASHGQARHTVRAGFLMSSLGVLTFMWALAAATLAAQSAGMTVGWGLQFQNPVFLALMFVVLAVFAANMFGVFEITLPSGLQTRLARSGMRGGYAGDFATGTFAAVLATPCSAPFLGTAVAFALSGRVSDIFIVFTALGLGLALPYLLVAAFPGVVGYLPKPGRWMTWLKIVLGVLLGLTAAWLIWVLNGVGGFTAAVAVLVLTAMLLALLTVRHGPQLVRLGMIAVFLALPLSAAAYFSNAASETPATSTLATNWVAFDRAQIARLVSQGNTVFVDVTADWCLTCKANKALVIDREPVASALEAPDVIAMQADWTRPDDNISRYLESFNRFGIPFNAVYGPGAPEGIVLSEVLTASAVLEALERARTRAVVSQ